jgi:uncharacterized membrane protein
MGMLSAEDFRKIAREALQGKWALAVITGIVATLLGANLNGGGSGRSSSNHGGNDFFDVLPYGVGRIILIFILGFTAVLLLWAIVTFIIGGAIKLGYCRFNKNLIQGTNPQFSDLFSRFELFAKALGLRIVTSILIALWAILLVIPGIIAMYRYSMAFYIMNDDPSVGIMEAIERSKQMMMGNKGRLFCLHLSFIGWAILCVFTMGIGFLWLAPYFYASEAAFYLEVSGQRQMNQMNSSYQQ